MDKLKSRDEIGDCIELIWEHHPEVLFRMENATALADETLFCQVECGEMYTCGFFLLLLFILELLFSDIFFIVHRERNSNLNLHNSKTDMIHTPCTSLVNLQ